MRVVVTRPQADGERTAARLRALGHRVLLAPLMQVETISADLTGAWGAVLVTSANAPDAIRDNPARRALLALPVYAVGRRSAQAAQAAGFADITAAAGNVRDLVQLVAERHAGEAAPLLYLAGEDRAADLIGELAAYRIRAEMRVVYRAVTMPFPPELTVALEAGDVEGVLHFSPRSADNYVAGARAAGVVPSALGVRHYCLSQKVAEPLAVAGAKRIAISPHPDETSLIELLPPLPG
jgi:uroporphyrinogen-III synthase